MPFGKTGATERRFDRLGRLLTESGFFAEIRAPPPFPRLVCVLDRAARGSGGGSLPNRS